MSNTPDIEILNAMIARRAAIPHREGNSNAVVDLTHARDWLKADDNAHAAPSGVEDEPPGGGE